LTRSNPKPVEFDGFRRQAGLNMLALKAVDIFGADVMTILGANV
jgi:hypothetical protein